MTVVLIVLSDHGEEFGEHGNYGHSRHLYNESIHVPLIVRFPESDLRVGRVDTMVAMLDVFSTVLDLWGIKIPNQVESESLLPLTTPNARGAYGREAVFSTLDHVEPSLNATLGSIVEWSTNAVQTTDWKYLRSNRPWVFDQAESGLSMEQAPVETAELYNLKSDPKEMASVSGQQQMSEDTLREQLGAHRLQSQKTRSNVMGQEKQFIIEEINKDTIDGLEALGYL